MNENIPELDTPFSILTQKQNEKENVQQKKTKNRERKTRYRHFECQVCIIVVVIGWITFCVATMFALSAVQDLTITEIAAGHEQSSGHRHIIGTYIELKWSDGKLAEMFTNKLSWLRHANVDFDKKEPDIQVLGTTATHLYISVYVCTCSGSRGVSRNSSNDVNSKAKEPFLVTTRSKIRFLSSLSFLFHSYGFSGCISRWINELLAAYFPEKFQLYPIPTVPSAEKSTGERKRETH